MHTVHDFSSNWKNSRIVVNTSTKPIHLPISIYQDSPEIYIAMLSNITDYSYFYLNFNSVPEKTQKQYFNNNPAIFNIKNDLKVVKLLILCKDSHTYINLVLNNKNGDCYVKNVEDYSLLKTDLKKSEKL